MALMHGSDALLLLQFSTHTMLLYCLVLRLHSQVFYLLASTALESATNYRTNLFTNPVISNDSSYSSCLWHK